MKKLLSVITLIFIYGLAKAQCVPPTSPTISADNTTVCYGVGHVITSNIQGISYFFEWYKNNAIVASGVNMYNPYFNETVSGVYKMRYYNISNPACYSGFSNEISITVVQKPTVQATPSSQDICSGSNTNITLSNPNNISGTTFHWDVTEGDNVGGATSGTGSIINQTLNTYNSSTNGYIKYSIRALANGCYGPTTFVTVNVYSLPVIHTTTPTTFCEGGSVLLTGSPVGQTHTFEKNGVVMNTTSSAIYVSESGNYTYSISAAGNPGCTQTSEPVSVNVFPTPIATITSATTPPTFCTGQSVVLVANPPPATGNFSYSWVKNGPAGGAVGIGSNYTANSAGSYSVRVDNRDCSLQGNYFTWATISVTENLVSPGVIGNNQRICSGGDPSPLVETSVAGASGAIGYQWQSSTDNIIFTNINGATGTTYDPPSGLGVTTNYRRITSSTLNSVTCTANSNTITVLVDAVTGGTVGSGQTFCTSGDPVTFTQSTSSTGPGLPTYQWQSSLNNSTFTNISGALSNSYDPPAGLGTTTYYRRVTAFSYNAFPPLTAPCTASSNTITVSVNTITGGTVGANQTLCNSGDPAVFTQSVASTGAGTLSYQWQSSINNVTFINISGATATTYDPPAGLATTTYYKRIATSTLNSVPCTAESNTITVTVNSVTGGTVGSNQTLCSSGDPAVFTQSVASIGAGTLSYQWQSSINNVTFTNISGAITTTYDPPAGLAATTYYKRIATSTLNSVPCTAESNTITVTVNSVTGGTVGSNQTLCSSGNPAAFTQSIASTGAGMLSYQWQSSINNVTFTNISGATAIIYDPPSGLVTTTYYKRIATSTLNSVPCTAESNTITVTVNSVTGGTVGSNQTLCSSGDPAVFTQSVASIGAGTLSYQWQNSLNNVTFTNISGATTTTYDPPAGLATTTYYKRIATSTLSSVPCTAESNSITVTINTGTGSIIAVKDLCLDGYTDLTAGKGSDYVWGTSDTTRTIRVYSQGTYSVNYLNISGCAVSANIFVEFFHPPGQLCIIARQRNLDEEEEKALEPKALIIYPNPANNEINIQLPAVIRPTPIVMYDAFGRLVYESEFTTGEKTKTISTANFVNGVYLLQLITPEKHKVVRKVVITH